MKRGKDFVAARKIIIILALCGPVIFAISAESVLCQEIKSIRRVVGNTVVVIPFKEIPEASSECGLADCEWWKQLRDAGNKLQRKGDEKSTRKFVTLFTDGLVKAYRVPIEDRSPQVLVFVKPTHFGPKRVGKVLLSIEYRADASIGDVRIIQSSGLEMDESCIRAMRQNIFMPAIKDNAFVTSWQEGSCGFGAVR